LLKIALEDKKSEFFLFYLDVSSQKVEEFKSKYSKNQNAWQVLEILNEKHKDVVDQYQSLYFDIEME
jgi:ribosomal protein S6